MEEQRWEESERRSQEVRRSGKRKSENQEDAGARKGRKVAIGCVFPMVCGSGGTKSRLAKAADAETSGQMRDENLHAVVARSFPSQNVRGTPFSDHLFKLNLSNKCTPVWREAHFQVKSVKNWQFRTTFGSCRVEKVYADVARSTCGSQNAKNTRFGPLFDVQMSKKCTLLWREAHFQVKSVKAERIGPLLDVQMSKKCTLTNLTSLTNFTNLTFLTNLTNLTNSTHLTNSTNSSNLTNQPH